MVASQKEGEQPPEIKVARQFFRVLNLISAIGLPSVCRDTDTEVRHRCFHRANIKRMMMQREKRGRKGGGNSLY